MPANKEKNNERAAKYQLQQELRALNKVHEELSSKAQLAVQNAPGQQIQPLQVRIQETLPLDVQNIWKASSILPQTPQQLTKQDMIHNVEHLAKLCHSFDSLNTTNNAVLRAHQITIENALTRAVKALLQTLTIPDS